MQHSLSAIGRSRPTQSGWRWRWFTVIGLGVLMSITFVPHGFSAQFGNTVELSPLVAKSTLLSATNPGDEITVVLTLSLGDSQGAADFVRHVSTPGDPLYRKYITAQEFAARYGANQADFAAVKAWANANGLKISHEGYARTILAVQATVARFQTLFKTQLKNYRSPDGEEFFSASVEPTIPNEISAKIAGVIGLTSSRQYAPLYKVGKVLGENAEAVYHPDSGGTGPGGAYSASDLRSAYSIPSLGKLTPQTVAVFEQGGFYHSDVKTYLEKMNLPMPKVTAIGLNGYNTGVNNYNIELEAVLDIDMVIGINPDVKEVLVYEDGNFKDSFSVALVLAFDQVAADGKAQILSVSYGIDEAQQTSAAMTAENTALQGLSATGVTVLVSAGDNGAYGRTGLNHYPVTLEAPDPGSQPLVTCVGGTTLFVGPNESYNYEDVWNDLVGGFGATGGGVSSFWPIPAWQNPSYVSGNGGSSTMRNVPDVAAVANPLSGVAVYSKINGGWIEIGGTSVSAPIWAGYVSILNSASLFLGTGQMGFFNPNLNNLGGNIGALYDIWDGNNGDPLAFGTAGYTAYYGYDNCTGWGTIWGSGLVGYVLMPATTGTPPGAVTGFTIRDITKTTAEIAWNPATGANGYAVQAWYYPNQFALWSVDKLYVLDSKTTKLKLTGLKPGTLYGLDVTAVNSGGSTTFNFPPGFTTK
jgi:subtilase family serine protease